MTDRYEPQFGWAFSRWHRYFAWRPIQTVDRGWVWLRMVNRRRIQKHDYLSGGADFWFQHAIDIAR
ncbi:hypothetical protein [Rathayibacter sp. PhB127]|uniref:hypothetical protein n=1 Tax=Rathayibacter sp. PhB127 TaxID=2485176 RepID=UPI000F4CF06A|nr:hypothetical protein [Rathayibacter sp. PhB127]